MKLVTSRDNPLVKTLKRLGQSAKARREEGLTVLDSIHLVTAYEASGHAVQTLVASESGVAQEEVAAFVADREVVVLPDALYRDCAVVEHPAGLMALVAVPPVPEIDLSLDSVLLDGVQDPGNVGTLIRTAAAAGFRQVLLSPDCAGAWSPKVLRAGQGGHFVARVCEGVALVDFVRAFPGTTAVTCLDGATSLYAAQWTTPVAWIFGSEGQGVRPDLIAEAKLKVKIPMPGAVESLNVGAAAAVCLFETVRRRL